MFVIRRSDGQWVEITHRSGDVLRLRVYGLSNPHPGRVQLAFEDAARNFRIERPERTAAAPAGVTREIATREPECERR
jgi:hypothetical protein